MAIKERKQITGTEAQIKGYAGHNGVLAYATDTKHLHVLSGTAGTTTKLANVSDIPAPVDISGKADRTYVDTELAKKQAKGDYATNTALTQGLAGKANTSHTHTKSQITDFPEIPDTSTLIPKTGDRGILAGHEQFGAANDTIITLSDIADSSMINSTSIRVSLGAFADDLTNCSATKVIYADAIGEVTLESDINWIGGSAPTISANIGGFLIIYIINGRGFASLQLVPRQ